MRGRDYYLRSPTNVPSKGQFWEPTAQEKSRAEQISRAYALSDLGLTTLQLKGMVAQFTSWFENDSPIIYVQFFDPTYRRPSPDLYEDMLGGFPTYFTVSVNAKSWTVVDHYASPE